VIANGTQVNPNTRYGDYAQMTIDPNDDLTFWSIGEYFNGGRKNHVGVFQITPLSPIAQFSASTTSPIVNQTVTFTDLTSNSPTSWAWSFNPGTVTYVGGTSAASQNPQVQFTAMGNYTVTLNVSNSYGSDSEIKSNFINVDYCYPQHSFGSGSGDYISLVQLGTINNATGAAFSPPYRYYSELSTDLPRSSTHTITLSPGSYGGTNTMAVFIDYNKNGLFESSEKLGNVTSFGAFSTATITFTVPDNAQLGTTRMRVRETYANSDIDPCVDLGYGETEDYNVNILPVQYCTPTYINGSIEGDYISLVQLGSINNATGASPNPYYTYYSSMSTDLSPGSAYTITLSPGTFSFGNNISVWIDYDQNGVFESYEKLGNVDIPATPATGTISFTVPVNAPAGVTRMRVREVFNLNDFDPCSSNYYGETEDYNVNILPIEYCTPTYITGSGEGDYISLVQLGTINNPSDAAPFPYYTYYNTMSTNLDAGLTYTLTLSPGTFSSGNNISAWIDYNFDAQFDVNEKLGNVNIPPTPATGAITFTVPFTAFPGTTRMRVREVYSVVDFDPCSLQYYGETEDYNVIINNPNKVVSLTAFLEGLYSGSGTMNQANNELGPQFSPGIADQITVELHNAGNYSLIEHSANNVNLGTNGKANVPVPITFPDSYYITIKHRNSIETTTAFPLSLAGSLITYDFDGPSKAFGGNLLMMTDGEYVIYGGDANQDGAIDGGDVTPFDNDQFNYVSGYVNTDINGDGIIDSGDGTIIDNNQFYYIGASLP
jgi:PKD repeat protein